MKLKKLLSCLLALAMLLSLPSVFGGPAVAASEDADIIASGEVGAEGDNVRWVYTSDNELTLSGSGATAEYGYDAAPPWGEYRDDIKTVVVEEGITRLGNRLFYYHQNLEHATLPDSLQSIGDGLFDDTSLRELPNLGGVTEIPRSAFEECALSGTLVVPEGIVTLGNSCFKENDIHHLILPSTIRNAGAWYQFYDCPLETVVQPASFIMSPDFTYNRLTKLTLTGDPYNFPHGRFMFLSPNTEVEIPAGSSYKGFTGLYPFMHTRYEDSWYDWQYWREELMCFNEEAMGDYDSPEAQAEDARASFDWNFGSETYARLIEVDNPADAPIIPDETGKYYNVFGEATVTIAAHTHEWGEPAWTWNEDYSAFATFTCGLCGEQASVDADVTYAGGIYTATVVFDGETYTAIKTKTATLTIDMRGKAENLVYTVPVGQMLNLYIAWSYTDSDDGLYRLGGILSKPAEEFASFDEIRADRLATFRLTMPETDLTLYAQWNKYISAEVAVGTPKCGLPVADVGTLFTWSDPETFDVCSFETETDDTRFLGGKDYNFFASILPFDGYMLFPDIDPVVSGAELINWDGGGVYMAIELKLTAAHYADETSEIKETVLTPATATADGLKEVCVYCAGGCGEVVERTTEVIPATGEPTPDEPAGGACPYCGGTHDRGTLSGWWTELVHHVLYILNKVFFWWSK